MRGPDLSPDGWALKIESMSEEHPQEPTRADELFAAGCLVLERRYSDPGLTAQAVGEAIGVSVEDGLPRLCPCGLQGGAAQAAYGGG